MPQTPSALVIGCGAGREVFALSEMIKFSSIEAIDLSEKMLIEAKKIAKTRKLSCGWKNSDIFDFKGKNFDLIWVTATLDAHIQGRSKRIDFYREIYKKLKPGGIAFYVPRVDENLPLHIRLSSAVLRLRWLGQRCWESEDYAISFLGNHTSSEQMIYSHIYSSMQNFFDEVKSGGLALISPHCEENQGWIFERPHS